DELVAVNGVEVVGFLEGHAEKPTGDAVPERRAAALVDDAAKLGENPLGEAQPVHRDEQVAASRQQQALAARSLGRVEEQSPDLARSLEVGDEAEQLGSHGAVELLRVLSLRGDAVRVERQLLA